jgi:hypothetical protein
MNHLRLVWLLERNDRECHNLAPWQTEDLKFPGEANRQFQYPYGGLPSTGRRPHAAIKQWREFGSLLLNIL